MLRLMLAAALAFAVPSLAEARIFKLGTPVVASVDLPANWKPTAIEAGVEAVSPDEEIYLAVEVASVASAEKAVTEALEYLLKQGVKVDDKTVKQTEGTINGMPLFEISAKGQDDDGAETDISVAVAVVNETTMLVLTYWGSETGEKNHAETLVKIAQSLKKAG
ncbi:histidine kinase [Prosthecomicrobium sp. N25]|uniref:histidine kinase n=1 Tax=Prosthecomicrobium sp. N25 TaxID=3129254 RepID=UPI003076F991